MKQADALRTTMLALVDAMIADTARFGAVSANPFYSALVNWSALQTATTDTTKEQDQAVVEALRMYCCADPHYQ